MNNTSNALGFVLISLVSIVVATAVTLLFAFGFLPTLATSVIYINVTSILLLALTLVFAFILYLKRGCTPSNVVDNLRALIILSAISIILGFVTAGLALAATAVASIILVALLSLAFTATLFTAVKLVFDFLNKCNTSCGCRD
ncbi:MAG: hypothetical protein IJY55_04490 [Clostridia bacterium]|nr:hypothetical protein [Clostridia bacterium]